MTIQDFLESLSSKTPTPGGGSASALCACVGVSLGIMVARYSDSSLASDLENFKSRLYPIIEEDSDAYEGLRSAMKLPKSPERTTKMQEALVVASKVPFKGMDLAKGALQLMDKLADKFNVNLWTDLLSGADMLYASINGFSYNVLVNVKSIKDEEFKTRMTTDINRVLTESAGFIQSIKKKMEPISS